MTAKPTVSELGIDLAAQVWHRSGRGENRGESTGESRGESTIEVAFARAPDPKIPGDGRWVLMRVTGDTEQRVLVFDRREWECFLDGARNGKFDDAAEP